MRIATTMELASISRRSASPGNNASVTRAGLERVLVEDSYTGWANSRHYGGHGLLHLQVSYEFGEGAVFFFHILNLAERAYATREDVAFGNDRYFPGEGRTFQGGIRLQF